jgi:hypothetical protein
MKRHPLHHYLITVPLHGGYMHGYVMTLKKNEPLLLRVADWMMGESEKRGLRCWPPMILQTHLSTGWKIVREVIGNHDDEPARHWKNVKDFHFTGWFMVEGHPDQRRLMELH